MVVHPIATRPRPSRLLSAACSWVRAVHCEGVLSPGRDYPIDPILGSKTIGGGGLSFLARIRPIRIRHPRPQPQLEAGETRYGQSP